MTFITITMKYFLTALTLLIMAACNTTSEPKAYPTDILTTATGDTLKITFFAHASLALEFDGRHIYIDPVSTNADYARLPKADMILITHAHYDHFDTAAIETLCKEDTRIIQTRECFESLGLGEVMRAGDTISADGMDIRAVPAYNTTEGHTQFHPKGRDNGYVLTLGGTDIYIAGDSEPTPEMLALKNIDIAFLPVNQPYTMTEEQAAEAVRAITPKIFYPYHYGQVEQTTDMARLEMLIDEIPGVEMRVRPME